MWARLGGDIVLAQKTIWLGELIENWMGPKYRPVGKSFRSKSFSACHSPFFLRRSVYGDATNEKVGRAEWALHRRYNDWQTMAVRRHGYKQHLLPSPYNKGKAWYEEARITILQDLEKHRNWTEWMSFWNRSNVFDTISYLDKLKAEEYLEKKKQKKNPSVERKEALLVKSEEVKQWSNRHLRYFRHCLTGDEC